MSLEFDFVNEIKNKINFEKKKKKKNKIKAKSKNKKLKHKFYKRLHPS